MYKSTTFNILKASKEQNSMENVSSFQHFGKSSSNFHEAKTCGFGSHLEAIFGSPWQTPTWTAKASIGISKDFSSHYPIALKSAGPPK